MEGDERMNGWKDNRIDKWKDKLVDAQSGELENESADGQMDERMGERLGAWADECLMGGLVGRLAHGWHNR
jgi:hypothetical protein